MPNHLAFDQSSKLTGWAYLVPDTLAWYSGVIDMRDTDSRQQVHALMDFAYKTDGIRNVVLEGVWHRNAQTTIKLAQVQERLNIWATDMGFRVRIVPPMTWKRAMLTASGHFQQKRKWQKDMAVWVAQNEFGMQGDSEDEADAICIAAWADANPEDTGPAATRGRKG